MELLNDLVAPVLTKVADVAEVAVGGLLDDVAHPVETPNVILTDQSAVSESELYAAGEDPPALTASSVQQEVGQINVQRYMRLQGGTWDSTQAAETAIAEWTLPDVFNSAKLPTTNLMKNYLWMRSDFEFNLIVNANMGFAGALVLVYVPNNAYYQFKTFRNFPHAIINCGLNTSARLKIPYVNQTQYCGISGDTDNCGKLKLISLATLKTPSAGGQQANWTLYGRLVAPEFQAFAVLEGGDSCVRVEEAMGSMYLASRHHTALRPRMGLTSEHADPDQRVAGDSAYTNLKEVVAIESFWQALDWTYTDEVGKRLTISNVVVDSNESTGGISRKTNLGFLSNFYLAYQGDLVVTIQAVASRLNQGKLLVVFYPGEDNKDKDVTMDKVNNAFTQILDLGSKTTVRFTLPFVNQQPYRPMANTHGRFAVFVLNPLTYTPACPSAVRILFYIGAGSSFNFVYPKQSAVKFQAPERKQVGDASSADGAPITNIEDETSNTRVQKRPVFRNVKATLPRQIKSDHMLLSNLVGRAFALEPYTSVSAGGQNILLKENNLSFLKVFKLFLYRSGDMTLHVSHTAASPLYMAHSYIQTTIPGTTAADRLSQIMSQGSVCVMANSAASLCVPFYVMTPFVKTADFGRLFVEGQDDTTWIMWMGATFDADTRFYFLQSPPDIALGEDEKEEVQDLEWVEEEGSRQTEVETIKRFLEREGYFPVHKTCDIRDNDGMYVTCYSEVAIEDKVFRANSFWRTKALLKAYRMCKEYVRESDKQELLRCGDVESNPGPNIWRNCKTGCMAAQEGNTLFYSPDKQIGDTIHVLPVQNCIEDWKRYSHFTMACLNPIWTSQMPQLEHTHTITVCNPAPETAAAAITMMVMKVNGPRWLVRIIFPFLHVANMWDLSTGWFHFFSTAEKWRC